ncbi:hypothetical protein [Mycolicibacterium nivoides]|uniref:Uncharacterized protein n=1 Tax=Mycolicibacterium nivoides TaxID=2487344 RepID=A0ABW9L845_9MYCO
MTEPLFLLGALALAAILAVRIGLRSRSSRAEGSQHATAPGEVSGDSPSAPPSPGGPNLTFPDEAEIHLWPDSLVLTHAANCLHWPANARLVAELRDRAAQLAALESLDTQ